MLFFLRKKQKVFRWKRHHNILILKEVLSLEPHRFKKGSKERGQIWNQLASNLNGIPDPGLNTTQRGVRTQYDKLIEDFVQKEREEKKATGIDADYDELDQPLKDSYERQVMQQQTLQGKLRRKKRLHVVRSSRLRTS